MFAQISLVNDRLSKLAKKSKELEPSRRGRSQWLFAALMRGLSGSLFKALDGATARCCASPHEHEVCLRLSLRNLEMEPGSIDEEVVKELGFHVALGIYNNTATSGHPI